MPCFILGCYQRTPLFICLCGMFIRLPCFILRLLPEDVAFHLSMWDVHTYSLFYSQVACSYVCLVLFSGCYQRMPLFICLCGMFIRMPCFILRLLVHTYALFYSQVSTRGHHCSSVCVRCSYVCLVLFSGCYQRTPLFICLCEMFIRIPKCFIVRLLSEDAAVHLFVWDVHTFALFYSQVATRGRHCSSVCVGWTRRNRECGPGTCTSPNSWWSRVLTSTSEYQRLVLNRSVLYCNPCKTGS